MLRERYLWFLGVVLARAYLFRRLPVLALAVLYYIIKFRVWCNASSRYSSRWLCWFVRFVEYYEK